MGFREIQARMTLELKTDHAAKLFLLLRPHDCRTNLFKGESIWRRARLGIFFKSAVIHQILPSF